MDLIDLNTQPENEARFPAFIDDLCNKLDIEFASYAAMSPISGDVRFYANYPASWVDHYSKNELHHVDPAIHMSAKSVAPVDWQRFNRDENFDRVFGSGRDFGIPDVGLSVPIRGPFGEFGLLSVSKNCSLDTWQNQKRQIIGDLQVAAVHMHDNVMQTELLPRYFLRPQLSLREKEILQWAAAGKSQQDIGDILSISHRTVEVHLRSGREKLNTLTTAQAVGRAVALGLIYPG
ncbi:autoinducer binding domain-containing protein [Cognatishimia activa]|uniref:Transcriptional activator protein LuxR n=1 Tax=Cognatishimia activa TaxID=1715691 RepID=A0A0P1J1L9_9RHOB|nr:autoinducer binding domain-containing protein [Cognatishimia activa]MEE2945578.1 LuxR family transcriptional regulator [Pseudomonadota bacterium]CUI80724.1 Transcriptional activator protein LuxR [Cognatishimia activa]CUK26884.1 Transcriptional activator protein LuxR [Cognatishimia activa]